MASSRDFMRIVCSTDQSSTPFVCLQSGSGVDLFFVCLNLWLGAARFPLLSVHTVAVGHGSLKLYCQYTGQYHRHHRPLLAWLLTCSVALHAALCGRCAHPVR
jgi:hypothetical protein